MATVSQAVEMASGIETSSKAARRRPPDVFCFLDYREFLKAAYADHKERGLSHRWLARRAGIGSPSFLRHVMDGKRNLSSATAARVSRALGLEGDAADYFSVLVVFNQATEPAERRAAYGKLVRFRRYQLTQPLDAASDAYHEKWYLPAIRELGTIPGFRLEPRSIAAVLRPKITLREARQALGTLERLGLLRKNDRGELEVTAAQVTTELETKGIQVAKFHRAMMERAAEAIDDFPAAERDISSITLSVDREGEQALKRRLQELRRELLDEFGSAAQPTRVLQVNFQLFPLSADVTKEEE